MTRPRSVRNAAPRPRRALVKFKVQEEWLAVLEDLAKRLGLSRAQVLRRAVEAAIASARQRAKSDSSKSGA